MTDGVLANECPCGNVLVEPEFLDTCDDCGRSLVTFGFGQRGGAD